MKILKIEFRNFASYGNKLHIFNFDENTGNFYLVLGGNGAGKSTISDVIKFSLYGKLQDKKLKDIPNRFNKSAWTRITIEKNSSTTIVIERGLEPNILRLLINGTEYDQSGKKNVQNYIEDEILGIPFYLFNNIISLSINDFKSFLNMGVNDKRSIIDKIFGLEIANQIYLHLRNETREIKNQIQSLSREIDIINNNIEQSQNELSILERKIHQAAENKYKEIENLIEINQKNLNELDEKISTIENKERLILEKHAKIDQLIRQEYITIHNCNEKERLYRNDCCPTCGSNFDTDSHKNILNEHLSQKKISEEKIEAHQQNIHSIDLLLNKSKIAKKKIVDQRSELLGNIQYLQKEIEKISDTIAPEQSASLKKILQINIDKKENTHKSLTAHEKKETFYKVLETVFGDKGFKQMAIRKILPVLNGEINAVLTEMNLEYKVKFNDEFDVNIEHLGHEVTPQMLSTGERKKIDFAVLIAFIKITKIKFQNLNLIFLDEIFSSVDADGVHQILKILAKITKKMNLNIFVINHSQLPINMFDYKLEIAKNNGFSFFEIHKID